jgi:hypothetical protein
VQFKEKEHLGLHKKELKAKLLKMLVLLKRKNNYYSLGS